MFFRRRKASEMVSKGAVFERRRPYNMTERVIILWVGTDAMGIPHVRYRIDAAAFECTEDIRILALETFIQQYRPSTSAQKLALA